MTTKRKSFLRFAAWLSPFLLLSHQRVQGQNIVPNPSFEDVNTCSEFNQPCSPAAWFYLSRKFTTGYYPRFPSATGNRHLQIVAASRETPNRQYWETLLLCPLQAGERYAVSLKIAGPGGRNQLSPVCPSLRDIGFWFTNGFLFVQGDSILQPRTWLSFTSSAVKDLKNGWFEIKKEFVPTANFRVLVVGNFARADNVDIMDQRNIFSSTIDVLVDDISITRMNGTTCPDYTKIKDSLYGILRRHSDHQPGDEVPGIVDTTPDQTGGNPVPPRGDQGRREDSLRRPKSDTIIIHNIQFDFDKYLVQNPDTLQRYRSLLTRPGIKRIQVVGFTDDAGSEAYNLDLSQKRAREVARLLSSKFDIPPTLIESEGRGISRVYPSKFLNRRVEIYIFH